MTPTDPTWIAWSPTNAIAHGTELEEYLRLEGLQGLRTAGTGAPRAEAAGAAKAGPGWLRRLVRRRAPTGPGADRPSI